jgi:methionine sulfoxide reductase heme-binding subunit
VNHALWFTSRACGLVSLILLTATVVLGARHTARAATTSWPRALVHALHRNLALLAVAFVAVHVATAIIDPYAGIRWIDAAVPFASTYQPFWTGLGAVALDLLAAIVATSLVRTRMPLRAWRLLHLSAYGLWPVALVHGIGSGGADSTRVWVLGVEGACALAVAVAVALRLRAEHPDTVERRAAEVRFR